MPSFETAAAVLGAALIAGALLSGVAKRSPLTLPALFAVGGLLIGRGGAGWLDFKARSGFVAILAEVALIVILFRDGLEAERELLAGVWQAPLRKLALAMPITAVAAALAAHLLFGLSWTEALLLGALLSPTDPVLTSSIITNPLVPRRIRHSLNLESGLNDGLALPAVLAFAAALSAGSSGFVWWRFVIQDIGLGFAFGIACGLVASVLMPGEPSRKNLFHHPIQDHQRALYMLGAAFATYGVTVLSPRGNGFIAVFVAAIVLAIRRPEVVPHFERSATSIVEVVKLGIFLTFGSLLTFGGLTAEGWAVAAFVAILFLLARPLAVWLALTGTAIGSATKLFMGWFGPKGVATITFSLLVLDRPVASGQRIFNIVGLVVLCSVLIHGATDTYGANWIARRSRR